VSDGGVKVIATTMSGSISDWSKTGRIEHLFRSRGRHDVTVHSVDSHAAARSLTSDLLQKGSRVIISAGGSGTFNSVLEGCIDSGIGLGEVILGFLRKGSADLIGKTLGMPDDIEEAVKVFTESLAEGHTVPCDIIAAFSGKPEAAPRHFAGYGGAGIFGRIPHYTENRFTKYYKGTLSQIFGDLGPFFFGATLASLETSLRSISGRGRMWGISVDGEDIARGRYQAMIIVNGDLGPDLPFARGSPLGSGCFHLFAIRDLGMLRLPGQFRHAWDASIFEDPKAFGFETYRVGESLRIAPDGTRPFPVNIDGSTMACVSQVEFRIIDQIRLISRNR
jgi:diacylglycerol kinase family enzyme